MRNYIKNTYKQYIKSKKLVRIKRNIPSQIHNTALYLDAVIDLAKQFPVTHDSLSFKHSQCQKDLI